MSTRAVYFIAYTDVHHQATVGTGLVSIVERLSLSQKVNLKLTYRYSQPYES